MTAGLEARVGHSSIDASITKIVPAKTTAPAIHVDREACPAFIFSASVGRRRTREPKS